MSKGKKTLLAMVVFWSLLVIFMTTACDDEVASCADHYTGEELRICLEKRAQMHADELDRKMEENGWGSPGISTKWAGDLLESK